jgi:hypothetical protein
MESNLGLEKSLESVDEIRGSVVCPRLVRAGRTESALSYV